MTAKETIVRCAMNTYRVNKKYNHLNDKEALINDIQYQLGMSEIDVTEKNIDKVYKMVQEMKRRDNQYYIIDTIVMNKGNAEIMYYGYESIVARYFYQTINCNTSTAIRYIVDTYLECIDNQDIFSWIEDGNNNGKPYIWNDIEFKRQFKELFDNVPNINNIPSALNFIEKVFGIEIYYDYHEYDTTCLYTTQLKEIDFKFNYIECLKIIERLQTLIEFEIATDKDVKETIEAINYYLNDCFNADDYTLVNVNDFIENLNSLIGGIL